jgi:hypothetical protein
MKHTFGKQAKLSGIALAAVAAFAAFGTAQAAPVFTTADLSINSVGFLEAAFKETGLAPGASVNYTSSATDVGWVSQCFVKNKPVANLPISLHVAHTVDGLTTTRTYTATRQGVITKAILTAYPTAEAEVQEPLCPETEAVVMTEEITAIRWCNASLTDTTNGVSATEPELFLKMVRNGTGTVPSCETLATLPSDILGTPQP